MDHGRIGDTELVQADLQTGIGSFDILCDVIGITTFTRSRLFCKRAFEGTLIVSEWLFSGGKL